MVQVPEVLVLVYAVLVGLLIGEIRAERRARLKRRKVGGG